MIKSFLLVVLVFLLFSCNSRNIQNPPVLSYNINSEGKKEFYQVSHENFVDQFGNPFLNSSVENKVIVENFFFTRCPSICPPMRLKLMDLAHLFEGNPDFIIISHTIDPEYDTPKVLFDYWKNTNTGKNQWVFLNSDKDNLESHAKSLMTSFKTNNQIEDFYHSSYLTLLDQNQRIRGFYNSLIEEELIRLKKDIELLLKEN